MGTAIIFGFNMFSGEKDEFEVEFKEGMDKYDILCLIEDEILNGFVVQNIEVEDK